MAPATCSKKPLARTSPTRSPTKEGERNESQGETATIAEVDDERKDADQQKDGQEHGLLAKLDERWNGKIRPVVERMNGWM